MGEYSYLPLYGPLPGESFESQTVAFFERLDKKVQDNVHSVNITLAQFRTQISSLIIATEQNTADIASLKREMAQKDAEIALLQARVAELESNSIFIYPEWTDA